MEKEDSYSQPLVPQISTWCCWSPDKSKQTKYQQSPSKLTESSRTFSSQFSLYPYFALKNNLLFHCFSVLQSCFLKIVLSQWISNCFKEFVWHFLLMEKSPFLSETTLWRYLNFQTAPYPTVPLLIEDLWREGNSILRLFFTWDILSHPFPVVLIACYVHLLEVNLVGL